MALKQLPSGAKTIAAAAAATVIAILGTVAYQASTSTMYLGTHATGVIVYQAATYDDETVIIGGETLVSSGTGIDGGGATDAAVRVSCIDGGCATPEGTAAVFNAAINARSTNKVTAVGRDGGVAYYQAKDAGCAANVPIGGTLPGTATGMSTGVDPVTAGGQAACTIGNSFDPSSSGLIAPLNTTARTADGTKAWFKSGTSNTAWSKVNAF
jgi:hypothetical protein